MRRGRICASSVIHSDINRLECKRSNQQIQSRAEDARPVTCLMIHVSYDSFLKSHPRLGVLFWPTNYLIPAAKDLPCEKQHVNIMGTDPLSIASKLSDVSEAKGEESRGRKSFCLLVKHRCRVSILPTHSRDLQ